MLSHRVEAFDLTFVRTQIDEMLDRVEEERKKLISDQYYAGRASGMISALELLGLVAREEADSLRRRIYRAQGEDAAAERSRKDGAA